MPAYDNPARKIQTIKVAENTAGPDLTCSWVLAKGKLQGINAGDEAVELAAFTKLEISNTKQLKAGAGVLELIVGSGQ